MARFKVVIADTYYEDIDAETRELAKIDAAIEEHHCKTEDEVIAVARDADAVILQYAPITRRVIESLERCRVIVIYAIGYNNIDVKAAAERGIYVCNVPDYSLDEVSNMAALLILACARKLLPLAASVRRGVWDYTLAKPVFRMRGQTLGLVGMGRIPSLLARKMAGFGLNLIAFDPYVPPAAAAELGVTLVDFDTLLRESDYVSAHCPLTETTRHMFGRDQFRLMKPSAFFINTARGGIVNEPDLVAALRAGDIAGAGLDVLEREPIAPDNPLLDMDNVVVTPHIAWYSIEAIQTLQLAVAQEVARVLSGEKPKNPVNAPIRTA